MPAYLKTDGPAVLACMERMSRSECAALAVLGATGVDAGVSPRVMDSLVVVGALVPRNRSNRQNEISPLGAACIRYMGLRFDVPTRLAELSRPGA